MYQFGAFLNNKKMLKKENFVYKEARNAYSVKIC